MQNSRTSASGITPSTTGPHEGLEFFPAIFFETHRFDFVGERARRDEEKKSESQISLRVARGLPRDPITDFDTLPAGWRSPHAAGEMFLSLR